MRLSGKPLVLAMCVGQIGNLLTHVVLPAVMADHLIPLWHLTAGQAGLMASSFALGYMIAVFVLTTLTDRFDARVILLIGSAVNGLATAAFAWLAHDMLTGSLLWALAGIGFAGAYMPGLKALTDRVDGINVSRSITLYTASYSLGVGLSFIIAQSVAASYGWRAAFLTTAWGPLLMIAACLGMAPVHPARKERKLFDFAPVFRNRPAMGYVLGYGAHCFELYAVRTWIVAFWGFVVARNGVAPVEALWVSAFTAVVAMPASILGNEAAIRFGRPRMIKLFMSLSAVAALAVALCVNASPVILLGLIAVYSIVIPLDSGALTSGMSLSADPDYRGATMALHSTVGFGLSALGGWAVGIALDLGGGIEAAGGWSTAFIIMAVGGGLGIFALQRYVSGDESGAA